MNRPGPISQLRSDVKNINIKGFCSLAGGLPGFFREQLTVEQAKAKIDPALDMREQQFLKLLRTQVYSHQDHPYLRLLNHAGCSFVDLQAQVRRHGIEITLEQLAKAGVYLTSDEFKGKKKVVRGGESFWASPKDFEPRQPCPGFTIQSSGTKNKPVKSFISLEWLAIRAWAMSLFLSAHDLLLRPHALYDAILPGSAVNHLLINAKLGRSTERWFARKLFFNTMPSAFYHHLTTYLIVFLGKSFAPRFPVPEFTNPQDLRSIVRWIEQKQRDKKPCQITTIVSSAVRLAQAARKMGTSIQGVQFVVSGEPFTQAKKKAIEESGGTAISHYAYGGGINVGFACANAAEVDEIHVNQHMLALISHPEPLIHQNNATIRPLLCSTLREEAPRILLNVENGDYGTLKERSCGCPLSAVGFNLHLSRIRSYEKFTSEGMNFFYGDLFNFMEQTLPREFGGGPGDYQLIEEEDKKGISRLTVQVHPDVGELDEEQLLTRLRERFARESKDTRFVSRFWQEIGTLRVRRNIPYASARGKILPLHLETKGF